VQRYNFVVISARAAHDLLGLGLTLPEKEQPPTLVSWRL
jgi:hypothetical protein